MAKITINNVVLDPLTQGPALLAANLHAADASQSDYLLVQTKGPLAPDQRAALAGKGVQVIEYVPDDTYLAYYQGTDLAGIRALPFVAWANTYMRGFKVAPSLADLPPGPRVRNLMEMAAQADRVLSRTARTVDVVFHPNVDPQALRDRLAAAAHVDPDDLRLDRHKARLAVQQRYLPELAALDGVHHVEEVMPVKLHNNVARQILRLEVGNPTPAVPYAGAGQVVAVADTGFDRGSTTDVHPAFTGRVRKLYPLGRPPHGASPGKANDPDGHGTHVAGSVLGDGASAVLGLNVRGTAPQAELVLQSVLDRSGGLGGLPDDLHDLFATPYAADGARVHTNSWGSTVGDGSYNSNAREVDDFVWRHRDCVICFAAGNAGTDADGNGVIDAQSITPPATAKNCITVGASENLRPAETLTYGLGWPSDFPATPIDGDRVADNPDGMVAFSSRGPTQDQRIKPDVVAPGTFILSSRSRTTTSTGWKLSADPLYFFEGGTSMATPLVAGCAALVREFLAAEHHLATPSAALVKALLINGARDLPGQYSPSEADGLPNHAEGFGLVDMAATVGPQGPEGQRILKDEATALDTNQEERHAVTVGPGASRLKATLVWTDPPGPVLQNDLDLIIRDATGAERHGNQAPGSAQFDRRNNVEQVVWDGITPGPVEVIVRAYRVTATPQTFALVVRVL